MPWGPPHRFGEAVEVTAGNLRPPPTFSFEDTLHIFLLLFEAQ